LLAPPLDNRVRENLVAVSHRIAPPSTHRFARRQLETNYLSLIRAM
jgi:hypothetical protein